MNFSPLFRKIVMGAAEATLDIAGAAVLPGAWSVLKGALEPVLERLKERFGGQDVTTSPELAEQAVKQFETDTHLQEILRSNLLERLDALGRNQETLNADVQKLMLIVTGDQKLLGELVGGVERIEERLQSGVNLSEKAVEQLADAVAQRAENSRRVRALALREMGPVAQLVERQVRENEPSAPAREVHIL